MNFAYMPQYHEARYVTDPRVQVETKVRQSMMTLREWDNSAIKPTDELGLQARLILGENGCERFEEFLSYPKGWDFGAGMPLSPVSVAVMEWFLSSFPGFINGTPTLFLTQEGNLQLDWDDTNGECVSLEFYPDRISYYIE